MNWKYPAIKIVLLIIIIFLVYLVYESIMTPLRFSESVSKREKVVIENLKDIRNSQQFYKQLNGKYIGDFDTLIEFLKTSEIPIVKKIPDPSDTTFTLTINDTVGYVKVADSLFRYRTNFHPDSLKFIPFSRGEVFALNAGEITRGGLHVNVFESKAHYKQFLKGLDPQLGINLIKEKKDIDRYPGLKVGSMQEPSTDGNWE